MRFKSIIIVGMILALGMESGVIAAGGVTIPEFIWAGGSLYATDSAQVQVDSSAHRNGLYIFQNLKWQRPVAEAAPGDKNYQNGRWQVIYLNYTPKGIAMFDVNNDGHAEFELTSWEKVQYYMNDLGCFEVASKGPSFNCPVSPPTSFKGLKGVSKSR